MSTGRHLTFMPRAADRKLQPLLLPRARLFKQRALFYKPVKLR